MIYNKLINNIKPYSLPKYNDYKYKLDLNENQFEHSKSVIEELNKPENITLYPVHDYSLESLLNEISNYNLVNINSIILTHGSDNCLRLICETYQSPDNKYLILTPTYTQIYTFIDALPKKKIEYLNIDYKMDDLTIFNLLLTKLREETYTFVYIVSPNNPIGYYFSVNMIKTLAEEFDNTLFLIDEAYYEYSPRISACTLINEHKNIIVSRTFSKFFGLTALRIGYILTHPENIEKLNKLNNTKDVTNLSIRVANKCLKSLNHYYKQIPEYDNCKKVLKIRMDALLKKYSDGFITGYNLRYGMFFLLFSKNSKVLINIFKQNGILIRDKHDEIPYAVRITIPTLNIMNEILTICENIQSKYFNLETIKESKVYLFDLDYTLRKNSHFNSDLQFDVKNFEKIYSKNVYILTNNSTPSFNDISTFTKISEDKIINPICSLPYYVEKDKIIYVIGNNFTKKQVTEIGYIINSKNNKYDVILFANTFYLSALDWIIIANNKNSQLILTEFIEYSSLENLSDISLDEYNMFDSKLIIPDMGSYVKIIEKLYPELYKSKIILGKPNINCVYNLTKKYKDEKFVVIGDSLETDIKLANNLNSYGILLSDKYDKGYDYLNNCYIIHNLNELIKN